MGEGGNVQGDERLEEKEVVRRQNGQGMRDWESEGMSRGDGRLGERGSERAEWVEGWEIRRERE